MANKGPKFKVNDTIQKKDNPNKKGTIISVKPDLNGQGHNYVFDTDSILEPGFIIDATYELEEKTAGKRKSIRRNIKKKTRRNRRKSVRRCR